jgi:hypothetical protein
MSDLNTENLYKGSDYVIIVDKRIQKLVAVFFGGVIPAYY